MITIVSNFHNRPDFISLQWESIRKHVLDDEVIYIVANSAEDRKIRRQIKSECKALGIKCIPIRRDYTLGIKIRLQYKVNVFRGRRHYRNGNLACSYTLMYLWKHFLKKVKLGMFCVMDSDMFFCDRFEPSSIVESKQSAKSAIAFVPILRSSKVAKWDIYHPWNGLFLANSSSIQQLKGLEWHPGQILGMNLDVGGQAHHWIRENRNSVNFHHFIAFSLHYLNVNEERTCGRVVVNGSFLCEFNLLSEKPLELEFNCAGADAPYLPIDFTYLDKIFGDGNGMQILEMGISKLLDVNKCFHGPEPKYFDLIGTLEKDEFREIVFHYKSVSNYQEWSSEEYNQQKTQALRNFLSPRESMQQGADSEF